MKFTLVLVFILTLALCDSVLADGFGSGANAFTIDFVTVGNPGNVADTPGFPHSVGAVAYTYNIGKYDVSRDMINKANAIGNLGITLTDMTTLGGNGVNRPASGASWNQAARFINWLNASTGSPLAYKFALQPGDVGYKSNADIQLWTPSDAGYDPNNLFRNSLAHYFLPSLDEWYKAAYYNPTSGTYASYPTGTNTAPVAVASGTLSNTAVYNQPIGNGPADITLAGGLSAYGTMGQGGNMIQWVETEFDLVNDSPSAFRSIRGSYWAVPSPNPMLSSSHQGGDPAALSATYGFRVASSVVPEPSATVLAASIFAVLVARCRRPR
jgi:formylglycine-generating enzyme